MQHYTPTRAIKSASHYDGLSGPTEELIAVAVGAVASQAPTVEKAFNLFRFNKANIGSTEADARVASHDVTPAFNFAFEAIKSAVVPLAIFTAPKNMKIEEKKAVHADLFQKFKDAYSKIAPPKSSAADAKAKAIADAKTAARAQIEARVKALKDRGAADARTGSYNPPAPTPPPDFDTINYQAGWQTVKPLPAGVAPQDAGSQGGSQGDTPAASTFPIVPVAIAAGLAAILLMRKK